MFRRPSIRYGKTPEPETPYQRAAQVWDDRIGSARVQARNWRIMAFGSLFLSAGFAAALVWQSARGTIVPWVVQVDHLGQAQTVAAATADYRPTDPQVAWTEKRYENGQLAGAERWTAILTIVIQTPRDAERLRANPLGIYVNAINWSREMSQ